MDIENLEYRLLEFAEGRLSEEEAKAVDRLLEEKPALREEMELYKSCPVVTETRTDVFPDKQSLARPVATNGLWGNRGLRSFSRVVISPRKSLQAVFSLSLRKRWAAAACVAGILVVSLWMMMPFRPSQGECVVAQMKVDETISEQCLQEVILKDTVVGSDEKSVCEKTYHTPLNQICETGLAIEPIETPEKVASGISEEIGRDVEVGEILVETNPSQGVRVVQVVRDTQKVYMNGMITYQESECNTMLCKASELMKTITKEIKQVPIDFINKNFIN